MHFSDRQKSERIFQNDILLPTVQTQTSRMNLLIFSWSSGKLVSIHFSPRGLSQLIVRLIPSTAVIDH